MARQTSNYCVPWKKRNKTTRDRSGSSVLTSPFPARTVDEALEAFSLTKLAMEDVKQAQDLASSAPAAHEAHLVLIPQPSTHPRDPLVCTQ